MEVIYLYSEELDTLQELNEVTNSKLIEIASEVSKELTERLSEAWDKLPNFKGDSTTKCKEVDELFAQNNPEVESVAESATTTDGVVDFNNMISAGGRIRNLPRRDIAKDAIPTDDCISRQAAIRWVKTECNPYGKPTLDFESGKKVIEHLEQMPPAQPERPKREWIFNPKDAIDSMFAKPKCPECGFESADGKNFCSNCGADMRGETENE